MMKSIYSIIFILLLVSCGDQKSSNTTDSLIISLTPSKAVLVPTVQRSCKDIATGVTTGSVPKYSASFNQFTLTWKDTVKTLYIAYIRLKFKSPKFADGQFVYDIAGDELDYLIGKYGSSIAKAPSATSPISLDSLATNKSFGQPCSLRIGGLAIDDGVNFTASGTLEVFGYTIDPTNQNAQDIIKQSVTVSIEAKN